MNTRQITLGLALALLTTGALADSTTIDEYALEPSINGGVSATGMFPSQEEEDRYLANLREIELDLEPCINGGVSAGGLFSSQEEEDLMAGRLAVN
jgi:hypothetical protein